MLVSAFTLIYKASYMNINDLVYVHWKNKLFLIHL